MRKFLGIPSLLLILLPACQKSTVTTGTIHFSINGKQYTASANYCAFDYYNNRFSTVSLAIVNGSPNEGYINLQVGPSNDSAFSTLYPTDSLSIGTTYHPVLLNYTIDSFRVIQSAGFNIVFSKLQGNTLDGSFNGIVTAIDTTTGALLADTISNGVFTQVPIQRIFH